MKKVLPQLLFIFLVLTVKAQTPHTSPVTKYPLRAVIDLTEKADPWFPVLKNQTLPKPHPGAESAMIKSLKQSLDQQYRHKRTKGGLPSAQNVNANAPVMLRNFQGNAFNFYVPNDNDVAISNGGIVASVSNTMIYGKNVTTNQQFGSSTLHALCSTLGLPSEEFDPKILYDPGSDRFIIIFLNGFTDSTSNVIVGFSQTNASNGSWNFYSLPGDALNTGLWTDFPMCSVGDNELFITVNLLYNDSSWQTGFNQSLIWQIKKQDGYTGQPLTTQLHSNIFFNGGPIRNLCPVKGGSSNYGPGAYFVSNRNFSTGTDSIFLIHVSDTINSPAQTVTIKALTSNIQYRMPLDADQPGTSEKLIVNDARTMGAFLQDDEIQFVFATLDTVSGYDGIYHGMISAVSSSPVVTANIYTIDSTDIAYPNIAYAGTAVGDRRSVIGHLYSSLTNYAGVQASVYDGTSYSAPTNVRPGLAFTNMLIGDERWGDYTGCQTKYDQPGYVWMNGSYTIFNNTTRTWIAELTVTTAAGVSTALPENTTVVFPNPAQDVATIRFNALLPGRITVSIYDNNGKKVHQVFYGAVSAGENELMFRTQQLVPGIYFVTVADEEGHEMAKEKLVKK